MINNYRDQSRRRPVIHVLPGEMALRVVCHASVISGIIGANGCVVSKLRRETGTKIHCESPVKGAVHWVVFIVGSTAVDKSIVLSDRVGDFTGGEHKEDWVTCDASAAQTALIRVLERSWAVLAAKDNGGNDEEAYCGILADRNQIGAVLGLGGKNVEWMRRNSGAMIRVLPSPSCGTNTDQLIQITGDVLAVKKALIMVSTSLQHCPPLNGYPPPLCTKPTDGNSEDLHSEFFPNLRSSETTHLPSSSQERNSFQDLKDQCKVVFKLICTSVAAGGVIGKQGTIIRALQNETGASISIGPPLKVSAERLVTISALENLESGYSHAQKALLRVYARSVESDVEKGLLPGLHNGVVVKAKLVVPSQFANSLIGNREAIIATGADLHIPGADQSLDCISENELVIEIKGEYKNVQNALSHVASKLRENLLPKEVLEEVRTKITNPYERRGTSHMQPSHQNHEGSTKNHNASRGDSLWVSDGEQDLKMVRSGAEVMKSIDYLTHVEVLKDGNGFAPPPSLLENDLAQGMNQLQLSSNRDLSSLPQRSEGVSLKNVTLELAVEKDALTTLYGRDGTGLDNLQQISGARVDVKDLTGILISGTPEETRSAMALIFSILADQ